MLRTSISLTPLQAQPVGLPKKSSKKGKDMTPEYETDFAPTDFGFVRELPEQYQRDALAEKSAARPCEDSDEDMG